jgi:Protein of unknown function (DUF2281)
MNGKTQELLSICQQLPDAERAEVADFARFLLAKYKIALNEDAAWERTIADERRRPKLDEFVRAAMAEGSEPLDPEATNLRHIHFQNLM